MAYYVKHDNKIEQNRIKHSLFFEHLKLKYFENMMKHD